MTNVVELSDDQLLARVSQLAERERRATTALIASLAELDRRQLYLGAGFSSLFAYCTRALLLSEHAAYARIEAARATRRFPAILSMLADGSLTLTAVCLLAPHLTDTNHALVLTSARHKSKREVEHIVAELRPAPDVPTTVRKLPVPAAASNSAPIEPQGRSDADPTLIASPPPRPIVQPLAPERYRVQFTVGRGTYDKLQQAIALMRHRIPNGDVGRLFDHALTLLIADVERSKCGLSASLRRGRAGRPDTRHIPAAVRRAVWKRDAGQCAFVGSSGRCTERAFLEYHHIRPFADGGLSVAENLSLRCRAHNQYEADVWFGAGPFVVRERCAGYVVDRTRSGPSCPKWRAAGLTLPADRSGTMRSYLSGVSYRDDGVFGSGGRRWDSTLLIATPAGGKNSSLGGSPTTMSFSSSPIPPGVLMYITAAFNATANRATAPLLLANS